jgi:hypothetical protein
VRPLVIALIAVACSGQEPAPPGILRGQIVTVDKSALEVRTVTAVTYRCLLDNRTYIERDGQRIFAGALRVDDSVEIVADRNATKCWARTVRIVRPVPVTGQRSRVLPRPYRALDHVFPRGNMTFAGVVRRVSPSMLVLHTRTEPEKVVLLRDDTRYLAGGMPSELESLVVNTRVFIRGGKNLEDSLEAYQVVWGEIPGPKREQ